MKTRHLMFIPILGIVIALFSTEKYPWLDSRYPALGFFGSCLLQVASVVTLITLLAG